LAYWLLNFTLTVKVCVKMQLLLSATALSSVYSSAHLTLILSLHYLVKCSSRLAVYNNASVLCNVGLCVSSENH